MAGLPEHLLRRSAEARAKAEGRDVEEVLAEMKGEAPPAPAADTPPAAAPAPPAPAAGGPDPYADLAAAGVPETLIERSREAMAKATGVPVAAQAATPVTEAATPVTPEPAPATPAPAAAVPAAATGPDPYAGLAAAGVPEILIERSRAAMAKATGVPVAGAPPASAPASVPAPTGGGVAVAAAPAPAPAAPAIPEGVRTQRLLTVVKAKAIQQVKTEPTDKVHTWPHLLAIEFVALLIVTAGLTIFSIYVDAPLLEFANFNEQPNPSKAPWYFLGLQELLSYFDPQVAGVIIPTFGMIAIAIIPFIDRNPSVRPADRKLAIMIFTFFVMASAVLTIFGSFFRGPGFNFAFPWDAGIFFDF